MYTITEITEIQNKTNLSQNIYNMAVAALEAPMGLNNEPTTLSWELELKDNANQDGFRFSCHDKCPMFGDFCRQYNITMEMMPTFYSSHVGVRLSIFSRTGVDVEVSDNIGLNILHNMTVEQLAKIKTAMLWIENFYNNTLKNLEDCK